jgi:phage shock protein A
MSSSSLKLFLCLFFISASCSFKISSGRYGDRRVISPVKMGIADRFFRVVKSNVNGLLSNLEDPEKIIDQAVNDMQNDLLKIRQSYADVSGALKRMEKQRDTALNLSAEWYKRAQLALSKNDEELAREALSRRQIQIVVIEDLDKTMATQKSAIAKLYASMTMLDSKILEAQREKDVFIARARTAKTSVEVNDMLNGLSGAGSNSMEAFERMKVKVESLESQAEVAGELAASNSGSTSPNMEERFRQLEGTSKIEEEMEQMRRMLPGAQKLTAELPPAGSTESELEKLRREMGL